VSLSVAPTSTSLALERADRSRGLSQYALLGWLIPLIFFHGLLYMVIMPPWQHYDEPTHFEYAWLIANRGYIPSLNEADSQMRSDLAESMYRFHFYAPGQHLDLTADNPPALGENQRVHPPLYYALVAQPLRLVTRLPLEQQLYVARTLSLILYVLTITAAWRVAVVVVPDEPLIQLTVPLMLLLTPSFADIMTAVNNDVLVNFAAVVLLLGCVLLMSGGVRPSSLALATLALAVGLSTKRTSVILLVPYLIALLWAWHRTPLRVWVVAGALVGGALAAAFTSLQIAHTADGTQVLTLRPWLATIDNTYLRLYMDDWIRSVSNTGHALGLYRLLVMVSFTSFWVRFGWGNVVIGPWAEWAMTGICAASGVGLLVQGWRGRGQLPLWQERCIWLFLIMVALGCLSLFVRLHPLPLDGALPYIPTGRYLFTIMLPAVWLIALGWQGLLPDRWKPYGPIILLGIWGVIDLIAWGGALVGYFYGAV
jgi:hypothetical protein